MNTHVAKPLWQDRRILVCVGTGGVGKTTTVAAIGLAAATEGLRTLVMTVDPARRLADALGLDDTGNTAHTLNPQMLATVGIHLQGSLTVMMQDVQNTFDNLIKRFAPSPEHAAIILNNRLYQHFSRALAGSHEYAAVEKLYEVYTSGHYDLIVLDTPPSQNALDFLTAPARILDFLNQEGLSWLVKPTRLVSRLSWQLFDSLGGSIALGGLGKVAGVDTLRELAELFAAFEGMLGGFQERSQQVQALLHSEELAFVLVTAAQYNQPYACESFIQQLGQMGMAVHAMIINRVRPMLNSQLFTSQDKLQLEQILAALSASQQDQIRQAIDHQMALAKRDQNLISLLQAKNPDKPLFILPNMPHHTNDLANLAILYQVFLNHS